MKAFLGCHPIQVDKPALASSFKKFDDLVRKGVSRSQEPPPCSAVAVRGNLWGNSNYLVALVGLLSLQQTANIVEGELRVANFLVYHFKRALLLGASWL